MPYDAHDIAVMDRINRYIALSNTTNKGDTIAAKLTWRWEQNIKEREKDSTDTVGRDADYYFAARHKIAGNASDYGKYGTYAVGSVATVAYIGLKWVTGAVGVDSIMRTDPDKPNAPPGGLTWETRGANDGLKDRGADTADVIAHAPSP